MRNPWSWVPEAAERAARAVDRAMYEAYLNGGAASFTDEPEGDGPASTGVPPEV